MLSASTALSNRKVMLHTSFPGGFSEESLAGNAAESPLGSQTAVHIQSVLPRRFGQRDTGKTLERIFTPKTNIGRSNPFLPLLLGALFTLCGES